MTNRPTLSLAAAVLALAAVTGIAAATVPGDDGGTAAETPSAKRLPVKRAAVLCPAPGPSDVGTTAYTSFSPGSHGGGTKGSATLLPAADGDLEGAARDKNEAKARDAEPVAPLKKTGTPVGATAKDAPPALIGTADGPFAPGWTVQQTSTVDAGDGRGLQGARCEAPDTEFWFPGVSTAEGRQDYVSLTNPDGDAAVVDLRLYGKDGRIPSDTGDGITVPARSSVQVLLSTLSTKPASSATLKVTARSGRVGAAVRSVDAKLGGDWLQAAQDPAERLVLPGIPEDATDVSLVAFAPGAADADLDVRLVGPTGRITPAGHESLRVKSGMTAAADLGAVTRGEAGSLLLTPADGTSTPVVAALRVTRGKGAKQDTAFIPATPEVRERASAAGSTAKGTALTLTAPDKAAKVRVTASAGSRAGDRAAKVYTLKAGTTQAVEPPVPAGLKGVYALTVERLSGGPVYAARTLRSRAGGVAAFTVQTLPDDGSTVAVPKASQELSVLSPEG